MNAKRSRKTESNDREQREQEKRRDSGEPGGGVGRREEVRGSGVYPPLVPGVPEDAEPRTPGQWMNRTDGIEGGLSELNPLELGIEYDENGNPISPQKEQRQEQQQKEQHEDRGR